MTQLSDPGSKTPNPSANPELGTEAKSQLESPPPSFVKLAMRNMVRKGGKSLFHFSLTTVALLSVLVGLAYLTR